MYMWRQRQCWRRRKECYLELKEEFERGKILTAIICAYEKVIILLCGGLRTQKAESRTCGEQITLSD